MGSLLTTANGAEITGIASGAVFLDFVAGTITLPEGSSNFANGTLVTTMNKNLNDLGLQQCNSIGIWCSDADSTYQIGSAITLSDHQLSHVVNQYGFSTVRIDVPANSTPDATNQLFSWHQRINGWVMDFLEFHIREEKLVELQQMLQQQLFSQSTLEHTINF